MLRDLAIVLMAAGATLIAVGGSGALIRWMRRRPWLDVLDNVEHEPPKIVMPLRCICTARLSFCQCAVDGVRNPRGAGRARSASPYIHQSIIDGHRQIAIRASEQLREIVRDASSHTAMCRLRERHCRRCTCLPVDRARSREAGVL